MEDVAIIQTYGQGFPHADSKIVCNKKGAEMLIKALQKALVSDNIVLTSKEDELFTSDGEGYSLEVSVLDSDKIESPQYTDWV